MKSRRDFLKTTATIAVAVPLASLPNFALAATSKNILSMEKEGVELRHRPKSLGEYIYEWIMRRKGGGLNEEENKQLDEYLKKNPKAIRGEVQKTVKQLTSGKYGELPDEKFASIRIKIKISFKPPDNFGIGIEISL